ncbi:MAG: T9SS type A sorting domain-containing protein [Candidatus Marinimicrobia bacterium]|nr:T9SS type A sorting domain-containing protein [FCB group bacterium]MBL7026185.1 T9SS type A sorting domain-containing protein [Candidatus Neomarinimicrobiota bacterium]
MNTQPNIQTLRIIILSFMLPIMLFGTIQEQIDAAVEGEIVLVYPGTYVENINFNGKNITLRSTYGPEVTIIDGNANGSTVTFASGETSAVLNGFTITGGSGTLNADGHFVGGGVACRFNSTPTLMNLIIEGNNTVGDSAMGGGIMCSFGSDALIQDVIIRNNEAAYGGGFCAYEASPILKRVAVIGNHARVTGGGLTFWTSDSRLDEVQVYDNSAFSFAAGIWVHKLATPVLHQVNVMHNMCSYIFGMGGGMGISDGSAPILINSIVWENNSNEIEFSDSMATNQVSVYSCDIAGGEAAIATNENGTVNWYSGNIDLDPEFIDSGESDFRLGDDSPCIDSGTSLLIVEGDTLIDMSHPEYWGANPDMGALETPRPLGVLEVPGAFASIQAAIDYAIDGDTLLVAAGTYYENINYLGKDIVVVSESGSELTIIDGSLEETSTVLMANGESQAAVLDGFTIQQGIGFLKYGAGSTERFGGGVCVRFVSSPTLRNLIISNNSSVGDGASAGGIGIAFASESLLENIIIQNNTAVYGGGLFVYEAAPILQNVTIRYNSGTGTGGGAGFESSTPSINNIVVHNNTAAAGGGGLFFLEECEAIINRATIYGNNGGNGGGGILSIDDNNLYVINSICWGNTPNQIQSYIYAPENWIESHIGVAYSDIQGGRNRLRLLSTELLFYENNLAASPLFSAPGLGDFSLAEGSLCIDAGIANYIWNGETLIDLSATEYIGSAPDMGAYESEYTVSVAGELLPEIFTLDQNYPNPFNPTTTISYSVPEQSTVTLIVFDIRGQELVTLQNDIQAAGNYKVQWNGMDQRGNSLSTGVYFCRLNAGSYSQTIKMVYLR